MNSTFLINIQMHAVKIIISYPINFKITSLGKPCITHLIILAHRKSLPFYVCTSAYVIDMIPTESSYIPCQYEMDMIAMQRGRQSANICHTW